ncbi:phage gp6-like head-tail connector protein, partial [Klebsiella pneumoniae]
GKDYDPAVLKQAVDDAVAALPPAQDGRDALQLEIQPFIDEGKSYMRGSYATHNGGLWRAYEKTHGMRGWECIVDGVSDVDLSMNGQRNFIVTVNRASGASEKKSFDIPTMVYRGVFKSGDEYLPGDTVTWGGSLWHCDEKTQDKPGETGSKGWTLAAKRGRDGRGKA